MAVRRADLGRAERVLLPDRGESCPVCGAAGGAAHLAGVMAAQTARPVLAVPMESKLQGIDSLLSMVQMPAGIPVATFAVGKAGAVNAALFSAAILASGHSEIGEAWLAFRKAQSDKVLADPDPRRPAAS